MSLVRSCYASLNCSALCKPSASFISSCITLGLLKAVQPPKTRTTSVNGFLCWVDRLLLSPTGGMVTLLMFIQFAALLNRELGAGVWLSAACLLQKIRSPSRSRPQLARRNRRPHQTHLLGICATLNFVWTWLSDFGTAPHPSDISSPASAILGSHQSAPPSASPVHHPLLAPQGSTDDPVATPAAAI